MRYGDHRISKTRRRGMFGASIAFAMVAAGIVMLAAVSFENALARERVSVHAGIHQEEVAPPARPIRNPDLSQEHALASSTAVKGRNAAVAGDAASENAADRARTTRADKRANSYTPPPLHSCSKH